MFPEDSKVYYKSEVQARDLFFCAFIRYSCSFSSDIFPVPSAALITPTKTANPPTTGRTRRWRPNRDTRIEDPPESAAKRPETRRRRKQQAKQRKIRWEHCLLCWSKAVPPIRPVSPSDDRSCISACFLQEKEVKRFDGAGYDKDLVEALERDIISQNPNVKWFVSLYCFSPAARRFVWSVTLNFSNLLLLWFHAFQFPNTEYFVYSNMMNHLFYINILRCLSVYFEENTVSRWKRFYARTVFSQQLSFW